MIMLSLFPGRKLLLVSLLLTAVLFTGAFAPDEGGPGLLEPEPIGAFLNDRLPSETPSADWSGVPLLLSQTGIFSSLKTLDPASGVLPFELIEPFWSDGAVKQRWMAVPNDGAHDTPAEQIRFSEDGVWEFPVGAVLIKHFEMPVDEKDPERRKRLETRLSVKGEDGKFYFLTYKWKDDDTDAELLTQGMEEAITIKTSDGYVEQPWTYPGPEECQTCHNAATGGTIGPRTRYLNRTYKYGKTGITANQLVTFSHLGILNASITDADTPDFLTVSAKNDPEADLGHRARSYLDLNCSYCHRPQSGLGFSFDARLRTPLRFSGLFSDEVRVSIGLPEERIIYPGEPDNSVLFHRVNTANPDFRMPPIARHNVDDEAVALLDEWISGLGGDEAMDCQPANLAKLGRATQSSTFKGTFDYRADNAIDGNTHGDDAANSMTQTEEELNPWWELDLGLVADLKGIRIWNRFDCCTERLGNFHILISEKPFESKELEATIAQSGVTSIYFADVANRQNYLDINRYGRYIRIQLAEKGILNLAEVEVEGCFLKDYNPSIVIGETRTIELDHQWKTIGFRRSYVDPVVVAGAPSYKDSDPVTVRVRNITSNSFEIRLEEWRCQDQNHKLETVPILVVEAGVHTLSNGKTLMAGKVGGVDENWKTVKYPQRFSTKPILLAQCAGVNEAETVIARLDDNRANTRQFRVKLVEQDGSTGGHDPEPVCWIAVEPGSWKGKTMTFEAVNSGPIAENYWRRIRFSQYYGRNSIFLGNIGSENGGDAFAMRHTDLSGSAVEVYVQEEICGDLETKHVPEEVHFLVFDKEGDIVIEDTQEVPPPRSGRSLVVKEYHEDLKLVFSEDYPSELKNPYSGPFDLQPEGEESESLQLTATGHIGTPALNAYPNPLSRSQRLFLELTWPEQETIEISLMDLLGRPVKGFFLQVENNVERSDLDLAGLNAGVYFLSVTGKKHRLAKRVVVE